MSKYDLTLFAKGGVEITIFDEPYNIGFIPAAVEKEMFKNLDKIQKDMEDLTKLPDEDFEQWKVWIDSVINHKRNSNEVDEDFIEDLGFMEAVSVIGLFVQIVVKRALAMNEVFAEPEADKKKEPVKRKKTATKKPTTTT